MTFLLLNNYKPLDIIGSRFVGIIAKYDGKRMVWCVLYVALACS